MWGRGIVLSGVKLLTCDWLLSTLSIFPVDSYWQPVVNDLQYLDSSPNLKTNQNIITKLGSLGKDN